MSRIPCLLLLLTAVCCSAPSQDEITLLRFQEAEAQFEAEDYDDAAPLYAYVVRHREMIRIAHVKLAICYEKLGRETEAIRVLERMLKYVDPTNETAMRNLLRLYARRDYAGDGIRIRRHLLENNPGDAEELRKEIGRLEGTE